MPAIPHVIRRGAVYYWRRRLPSALAESPRSATLLFGLRTRDPRRARFLAAQITALADCLFVNLMDQLLDHRQLQTIFRTAFTRHLDKLEAVAARERVEPDFDADDSRRSDRTMGWVYRLLETRGAPARVDDRVRRQMEDDGLDEQGISEVGLMLDAMRKNGLVREKPARLDAAITQVGGLPSPMNLALTEQAIFRALSAANFEIGRRHDGLRSEQAFGIDLIHRERIEAVGPVAVTSSMRAERDSAANRNDRTGHPTVRETVDQPERQSMAERSIGPDEPSLAISTKPSDGRRTTAKTQPLHLHEHPIVVLGNKLIEKNRGIWDPKTQRQAAQIYGLLAKVLLEQSVFEISDIRQTHFADLDDLLANVSKAYGKSPKDHSRTTAQLRAIGATKSPAERGLAPETLNRHFTFLNQLIPFLRSRGFAVNRDIDISSLRVRSKGRARDKRATIDDNELAAIFHLPCFTGCAGWKGDLAFTEGPFLFHRALYFAVILLYYTGARREEVCGLTVDEIGWLPALPSQERIPFVRIAVNDERRIKNAQSKRLVVLHPELVRLGFFKYVDVIRSLGYALLFPDLKSPTSSSPMGDRLYDEFSKGMAIAVPDAGARKKVIHSFRKTFGDNLKKAGVASEIRGDIMGHRGATVTEEIYCEAAAASAMLTEIMRLPIVTGHLEARELHLLPWVAACEPPPFSRQRVRKVIRK